MLEEGKAAMKKTVLILSLMLISMAGNAWAVEYLLSGNNMDGYYSSSTYSKMLYRSSYAYNVSLGGVDLFAAGNDQAEDADVSGREANLIDGYGGDGSGDVYGPWKGNKRVDVVFDLGNTYRIKKADLRVSSTNSTIGVSSFTVYVGTEYFPLTSNRWRYLGTRSTVQQSSAVNFVSATGDGIEGRYVWFSIQGRSYQLMISELGIFGDMAAASASRAGDANYDGQVDVGDLGILASNYGRTAATWTMGDYNADAVVDVGDLGILASRYGYHVPENSMFGVCSHFLHTDFFSSPATNSQYWRPEFTVPWIVKGNLNWVREPLYQGYFVASNGSLNEANTTMIDQYLTLYDQANVKVMLCPMFGMPDTAFNAYMTWVGQLAWKHPCVKAIELHNEPNLTGFWGGTAQDYVTACLAAYPILKQQAPEVPVVAGSFSGWGHVWDWPEIRATCTTNKEIALAFLKLCLEAGMLDACDAVSAHPYRQCAPEGGFEWESPTDPNGFEKEILYAWAFIQQYNTSHKPLKIYYSEIGYSSGGSSYSSVNGVGQQANYLSRLMLNLFNLRIKNYPLEGVFWYDLKCDEASVGDYESNFGLIANDASSARPGYDYYRRIASYFANTQEFSSANLIIGFNNQPQAVKSFACSRTNGSLVIPFWRMEQLQSADADFTATMTINGVSPGVQGVSLYTVDSDTPQTLTYTQSNSTLTVDVPVLNRASWLEVRFGPEQSTVGIDYAALAAVVAAEQDEADVEDAEINDLTPCSALGLPLIAGLFLMGFLLAKINE
jgi:hypothetical protein